VFFKGSYGPDLSKLIAGLAGPGMIAFDIGANVGVYSLLIAEKVGAGGMVYCFEPNPEVRDRLLDNIRLNNFEMRTRVHSTALSGRVGDATLYLPKEDHYHRGIGSFHKYTDLLDDQIVVQVETIDSMVSRLAVEHLDLVKIDTEGHDAEVILGGKETIARFCPVIIFEANYLAHPDALVMLERIRTLLLGLGYALYTIGFAGRRVPLGSERRLPDADILCIPAKHRH
jgi:FkbM family methyltransferase